MELCEVSTEFCMLLIYFGLWLLLIVTIRRKTAVIGFSLLKLSEKILVLLSLLCSHMTCCIV